MQIAYFIYAALLIIGGAMGASKSPISLIAGLVGGLLSIGAALLLPKNFTAGIACGLLASILMLGGLLPRFLKSPAIWPSGIIIAASAVVLLGTIVFYVTGRNAAGTSIR